MTKSTIRIAVLIMCLFVLLQIGNKAFSWSNGGIVRVSLAEASGDYKFKQAIFNQIDEQDLLGQIEYSGLVFAQVLYYDRVFIVFATCEQWHDFFLQGKHQSTRLPLNSAKSTYQRR